MSLSDEDKSWIAAQLQRSEERFAERLEAVETKLLNAFYGWGRPYEKGAHH